MPRLSSTAQGAVNPLPPISPQQVLASDQPSRAVEAPSHIAAVYPPPSIAPTSPKATAFSRYVRMLSKAGALAALRLSRSGTRLSASANSMPVPATRSASSRA
eukprot:1455197-Pleurochrysis_carterae.AAC.1